MAYRITFYCKSGNVAPQQARDRVVAESGDLAGIELYAAEHGTGDGWADATIGSTVESAEQGNVHMGLHTAQSFVRRMVEALSVEGATRGVSESDMVVILTLSGKDIDWPAVRGAWDSMSKLWQAIPYDDGSGFDVSLEDLG
jgi:hypothetical protein